MVLKLASKCIVIFFVTLLVSCTSTRTKPLASAPHVGVAASPKLFPGRTMSAPPSRAIPSREPLIDGIHSDRTYRAYGYVLFNSQADPSRKAKYLKIAELYCNALVPTSDLLNQNAPHQIAATYWPLRQARPEEIEQFQPEDYLARYDYATATRVLASVRRLDRPGPIVVAFAKPFDERSSQPALIIDFSDWSLSDLEKGFLEYKNRCTLDPQIWSNGLSLINLRVALKAFVDRYGETVVAFWNE